jgi:hypothetical protein
LNRVKADLIGKLTANKSTAKCAKSEKSKTNPALETLYAHGNKIKR